MTTICTGNEVRMMLIMRWLSLIVVILMVVGINETWAGGRLKTAHIHPMSDRILLNAWYRDDHINIAVCNMGIEDQHVKIAVGIRGNKERIYGGTTVLLNKKSIIKISFPLLQQQTPQGDLKPADHVFVFDDSDTYRGSIVSQAIQQIKVSHRYSELVDFIIDGQAQAIFRYSVINAEALTVVFIPKAIKNNGYQIVGHPFSGQAQQQISESELIELNIPPSYEHDLLKRLDKSYCFLYRPGISGITTMVYDFQELESCALIHIPAYVYEFNSDGSVKAGGGQGLTLMAYRPDKISIQPSYTLVGESGNKKTGYGP